MEQIKQPTFVLIIADSNFINICSNPEAAIEKLKSVLCKTRDLCLYTVNGRYGLSQIDSEMPVSEIEDRNKTAFSQTLENTCVIFDEFIVLTNTPEDPYIIAAREVATSNNKTFTQYGYVRR